jgi:hypothetical protein
MLLDEGPTQLLERIEQSWVDRNHPCGAALGWRGAIGMVEPQRVK